MTKRIISLAIFCVMFVASFAGGIYANVQAAQQRGLYNEQIHYSDKYEDLYNKAQESKSPIIGSQYFKNLYQEKMEEAQMEAHMIKKEMRKFFAFTAILYFVAIAMLACTIMTGLPLVKMKKEPADDSDDEPKPTLKAKQEPVKKERPKSDFDLILEAPKPSIRENQDNE